MFRMMCVVLAILFLASSAFAQTHVWSQSFGAPTNVYQERATTDQPGNVIISGNFNGTLDFGNGSLSGNLFVAKFNSSGSLVWSRGYVGTNSLLYDIATDFSGNILLTGSFTNPISFGCDSLVNVGGEDLFVAKLDTDGNCIWSKRYGNAGARGFGVTADATGNIYVSGDFRGDLHFGSDFLSASLFLPSTFVAKFDENGNSLWGKQFSADAAVNCADIAVSLYDEVFITGQCSGIADFGSGPFHGEDGYFWGYITKLDSDGQFVWTDLIDYPNSHESGDGLATDANGDIFVAGNYSASAGLFLRKYSSSGTKLWDRYFATSGNLWQVALDGAGNAFVAGDFSGAIDLGGGTLTSAGDSDVFFAKFSATGALLTSNRFGDQLRQSATGIATDNNGGITILGDFAGNINFGGSTLTSSGGLGTADHDLFLAKFSTCQHLFAERLSTAAENTPPGTPVFFDSVEVLITRAPGDTIYVSGSCETPSPWVVDDKLYIGTSPGIVGFNGDKGLGLPVGVPVDSILNPVPPTDITNLIPWGTSLVKFRLADLNRAIYGNTNIYLVRVRPSTLTDVGDLPPVATNKVLVSCYPNPFNPRTTIRFTVPAKTNATVSVYDAAGRLVATVFRGHAVAGFNEVSWDGRSDNGTISASGVYFCKVVTPNQTATGKLVLLK